jgi:alkanesulfonate monooxygenase
VFPLLPGKGGKQVGNTVLTGPFGEVMATELVPKEAAS